MRLSPVPQPGCKCGEEGALPAQVSEGVERTCSHSPRLGVREEERAPGGTWVTFLVLESGPSAYRHFNVRESRTLKWSASCNSDHLGVRVWDVGYLGLSGTEGPGVARQGRTRTNNSFLYSLGRPRARWVGRVCVTVGSLFAVWWCARGSRWGASGVRLGTYRVWPTTTYFLVPYKKKILFQ